MEGATPIEVAFAALARLFSFQEAEVQTFFAVFIRVGAVAALLPGFGERAMPARVRLVVGFAFTAIVWPAVAPALPSGIDTAPLAFGRLVLAEATCGIALGIAIRFVVFALQTAGAMASQATAVSQILGAGVTPDPLPAIGNALVLAGIACALAAGLHVKAAAAMIDSYDVLPFGLFPVAGDLAEWGISRGAEAFGLAFALAAPFLVGSLLYNVALGAINRAMPQLMVAFVGAPAITAGALLLLLVAAPTMLRFWNARLDEVLAAPFGVR